jgi:hypothetical protein
LTETTTFRVNASGANGSLPAQMRIRRSTKGASAVLIAGAFPIGRCSRSTGGN